MRQIKSKKLRQEARELVAQWGYAIRQLGLYQRLKLAAAIVFKRTASIGFLLAMADKKRRESSK